MTYDSRTETDERQLFCHAVLRAVPCRFRPSRPRFPGLVGQAVTKWPTEMQQGTDGVRGRVTLFIQLATDHNHIHIEVKGLRTPVNTLEEVNDDGDQDGFAVQQATYVRLTCTAR